MRSSEKPGIAAGVLTGVLLTLSAVSVFYLAWRVAGFPFVPYDVFDWLTRHLPGKVIAAGIDAMVSIIRALKLGPTASSAKLAEQSGAVIGAVLVGSIVATVFFGAARRFQTRFSVLIGILFGLILGIPAALVSAQINSASSVTPAVASLWILIVFITWGTALGWSYRRLGEAAATAGAPETQAVRQIDRRRFLVRLGGATAVITVAGATVALTSNERKKQLATKAGWSADNTLPNADSTVEPVHGTRAEYTPLEQHYRIDINTRPLVIDERQWRLKISGLVEKPLAFTIDELRRLESLSQFITLSCISNPVGGDLIGTTRWTGVSLQRFLPLLALKPGATHLKIRSADDFFEVVSLEAIKADERVMLAYDWDGMPVKPEHGFPLRIYIPDLYGMKQPKWIESIEVTDHWEPGYWLTRGWDKVAQMKATSVIDAVGMNMMIVEANRQTLVPIGGIAHAGARGISKVELQVDDGPWLEAKLRKPLSPTTWVVWRCEWPFQSGEHTFVVRCYEGDGKPQIVQRAPPSPSGASGLHSRNEML